MLKQFNIFLLFIFLLINLLLPFRINANPNKTHIIYESQKKLIKLGYNPGPIDGIWGKKTQAAILRFQRDQGLPTTGQIDTVTKLQLGILDPSLTSNNADNQISPPDTAGTCLEIWNLFREYQKNENQFHERFNDVPLCISGYPISLGEKPSYLYIDIINKEKDTEKLEIDLNLQCRIETLNNLHRQILKRILNINADKKIKVKGIYKPSTELYPKTLILNQCYLIQTAGRNE